MSQINFKIDKCPKCGKIQMIVPSNNPLTPSVCNTCITTSLQWDNIEHGDFFCRAYNLPFNPELWIKIAKVEKENTFKEYVLEIAAREKQTLYYNSPTGDLWKKANKEWELVRTHDELIHRIEEIKIGYIQRNKIKWGEDYSFQELIELESLFTNTLKANDISNPMQIDAIKKACKLSITLNRAIVGGDSKEINDLSKAYQNFIKTAKIDEIITAASQDVISNVAELVDFIEKNGFKMNYYDNVERDVVDKSIADVKQYIRRLVMDATGLETAFEQISNSYKQEQEIKADAESYEKVSLEDLYDKALSRKNEEFDSELEEDAIEEIPEDDFNDDEDDFYFG